MSIADSYFPKPEPIGVNMITQNIVYVPLETHNGEFGNDDIVLIRDACIGKDLKATKCSDCSNKAKYVIVRLNPHQKWRGYTSYWCGECDLGG